MKQFWANCSSWSDTDAQNGYFWNHARNEALISSLKPSFPHICCYWLHFLRKSIKIHRLPTTWILSSVTERHWKILKGPCNLGPEVTTNLHLHVTGLQKLPCLLCFFLLSTFWLHCATCAVLVPQPRIEPVPPRVEAWCLHHWTACECVCAQLPSRERLFATPRSAASQTPLSMGFSRQENWSGKPFLTLWNRFFMWIRHDCNARGCQTKVTSVRRKSWCQPIKWQRTGYFCCLVAMLPVIQRWSLSLLPFREPESP